MISLMMTARELKDLRAEAERLMPDICVLTGMVSVPDGEGGSNDSWEASGTVPCRLDNLSGARRPVAQAIQPFNSWTLTVPFSTVIDTTNRVTVNGYTFAVIAVSDIGSQIIVQRAALEWID